MAATTPDIPAAVAPPPEAVAPNDGASSTTQVVPVDPVPVDPVPVPVLAQLLIRDGGTTPGGYSRALFPTWLDLDGNGCDTRKDVLIAQSLVGVSVGSGCAVTGGRWLSLYDGVEVVEPSRLDIDHMVPLAEAWRSGANAWDTARRAAFANDLSIADSLIAVTTASNRAKGDRGPDQWRPPRMDTWCRYASAWVEVKVAWSLTATTRERDALGQMLDTC